MIRLENLTKVYGGRAAVNDVSLEVQPGELLVLVGPSGSGKSTILKMIAGLTPVTDGRIVIGNREVTHLPPQDRDIAMVFQNYALYPNMTVRKNLGFGLRIRKTPRAEIDERVKQVAELLGLGDLLERRPAALSGGERQRVAMGRAIVRQPAAFLLDEPLSNLDAKLRTRVRAELIELRDKLRTTTVYVTHDQVEAMTLGHRVAVLRDGTLQQVDTGHKVFACPDNLFVASFIGSPAMNFCKTRLVEGYVTLGAERVAMAPRPELAAWRDREIVLGVRPTDLEADDFCSDSDRPRVTVAVRAVEELGVEKMVMGDIVCPPEASDCQSMNDAERSLGVVTIQARVDARTQVKAGDSFRVALNSDAFYYFDPASERAVSWPAGYGQPVVRS
jgi:ABC-type sugar transport system ATPase subunit